MNTKSDKSSMIGVCKLCIAQLKTFFCSSSKIEQKKNKNKIKNYNNGQTHRKKCTKGRLLVS